MAMSDESAGSASAAFPVTPRACPACGSVRVYRSRRRTLAERALVLAGGHIQRCHGCDVRFVRFRNWTIDVRNAQRVFRMLAAAGLIVATALVFAFVFFVASLLSGEAR